MRSLMSSAQTGAASPAAATSEAASKVIFMFSSSWVERQILHGEACDPEARFAHVFAAQLAQRIAREVRGHVLAPVEVQVGVVHRLRARGDEARRFLDHLVRELLSLQKRVRLLHQERARRDRAERDAGLVYDRPGKADR